MTSPMEMNGPPCKEKKMWYTIENPEGFLNKNAVAARQLPVLAHQRIFVVSAYLHGIMDTAHKGIMSEFSGCVFAFAPCANARPGWLYRHSPRWEGVGLPPAVSDLCGIIKRHGKGGGFSLPYPAFYRRTPRRANPEWRRAAER